MGVEATPDFSGYATKAGLRCSDGRTIMPDAFKHQDQLQVPLVWNHNHTGPENVLGHVILEHRDDGVYCHAFFNDTEQAKSAKELVTHKDVNQLSIWANQLIERSKQVFHGMIKEVSLVLGGANPGALIDNVAVVHGLDVETLEDEAIIYTGLNFISHSDDGTDDTEDTEGADGTEGTEDADGTEGTEGAEGTEGTEDADGTEGTEDTEGTEGADGADGAEGTEGSDGAEGVGHSSVKDVYNAMDNKQKAVVHALVGEAIENATKTDLNHSDNTNNEGTVMGTRNVFENKNGDAPLEKYTLSHGDMDGIVDTAKKMGSLRDAVDSFALAHNIENIDVLFPEYRSIEESPQFLSRRIEWVAGVLAAVKHSPFTRIKSIVADITFPEARARGYVKGNMKKEEWLSVSKRKTTPGTIYKKQKLDRDDIIDITDFDVVMWLKAEMRLMFDEELARAILIGDGRSFDDEDKVPDPSGAAEGAGIRSIYHDHDLYASTATIDHTATGVEIVDGMTEAMKDYKGSGSPILYSTLPFITSLLTTRDQFNHRLWKTRAELAAEIGVADIVTVEVMEEETNLLGIIVNLIDYTIGADKGGEVNFFDFFDIDYNQYKYLYESRLSGALTKVRSAVVFVKGAVGATLVTPSKPDFNGSDVVVPDSATVVYRDGPSSDDTNVTDTTINLDPGEEVTIYATPGSGHYFADNVHNNWTFKNTN